MTNVLDKGFIRLVETMGTDESVVQAARISYGKGTKSINDDTNLIRYLLKHKHSTPFEMCEIKLHIKAPIFVVRQWMRHRTASINEYSARYSEMSDDFYFPSPDSLQKQSQVNKQGREGSFSDEESELILSKMQGICNNAYHEYGELLKMGLSREIARTILPINIYTEFYWKIDAHNLMHFLKLRSSDHAQYEIRVYADAILAIFADWMPITYQAFVDYNLKSVTLSRIELQMLKKSIDQTKLHDIVESSNELSKREKFQIKTIYLDN